jgi:HK97 family phage major capsid protein
MNPKIKKLIAEMNAKGLSFNGSIRAFREEGAPETDPLRFELSFSSEAPYERWFGIEVLGHKQGEVRMDWIASGNAPLLLQHNHDQLIGIIESVTLANGRGTAVVRFGRGELAQEIQQDVEDGIRRNVSVGYRVHEMVLVKQADGQPDEYRVTDWEPFEVSIVSVPADQTVGTNRSDNTEHQPDPRKKENQMTELEKRALAMGLRKDASEEAVREAERAAFIAEGRKAADSEHKQEIARRDAITVAGKEHGLSADAEKFIAEGKSADEFHRHIMAKYSKGHTPVASAAPALSKSDAKNIRQFSLIKAIREFGDGKLTGIEAEMHQQGVKDALAIGQSVKGLSMPGVLLNFRSNEFTATTEGTDLVQNTIMAGSFIDVLRAKLVLQKLGARILTGMVGDFKLPKLTAGATVTWEGEIDANAQTLPTTGQVAFAPNRVGCYVDVSKQLLIQSSVDVEMMLRNDLMAALAGGIEAAAITDLLGTSGIGAVIGGENGAAPDWADICDLESAVGAANGDVGSLAYLTNPKVRGKLKQTSKAGTEAIMIWGESDLLNGYKTGVTTHVPSTLTKGNQSLSSAIIFGNFEDLVIAQWGGMDLLVDQYTLAKTNLTSLVLNTYADFGVRNAGSFAAMKDALTA